MVSGHYRYAALALAAAAVVVAIVLIAGHSSTSPSNPPLDADGFPTGLVSYHFIQSRPEARLLYPNAKLFQHFGSAEQPDPFAGSSAFTGGIFTTPDAPQKIYDWYTAQLTASGWGAPTQLGRMTGQISAQGYYRGRREAITLGIDNPSLLHDVIGRNPPSGQTVFEYRYFINPYVAGRNPSPRPS